jgi:hypothetical protein
MNTGIGDAMNLGWKLAEAVRGTAPAGLLESYQAERHPVGTTVLRLTDAFNTLVLGTSAFRRLFRRVAVTAILGLPIGRRIMGGLLTGIGIHYARPKGAHKLVGRRMPDVDCGAQRLFELLRTGRFVLLTRASTDVSVDIELSGVAFGVHGDPSLPAAILIRPDGYVAWASDTVPDEATIRSAVNQWTKTAKPASRV